MKKVLILTIIVLSICINQAFADSAFISQSIWWYTLKVFKYDTNSQDYIFKVWMNLDYKATDLRTLMEKNNGIFAINWAYFCPSDYVECWGQDFTTNERYLQWYKFWTENKTGNRVVFALDENNKPFLYQSNKINSNLEWRIYYGIANFPLLLRNGVSKYEDYVKLGLIDSKMKAKMSRNFICSSKKWNDVYFWYTSAIELDKLPEVLLEFGCWNAINLDAWASSAMIYNWRYIIWPGRDILDWIIIERKWFDVKAVNEEAKELFERMKIPLKSKMYNEKIELLDNIWNVLSKFRNDFYDKHSKNVIWENFDIVGYQVNITNLKDLTLIYIINYLEKLAYDYKKDVINEENKRVKQEIDEENNRNGLF